MDVGDADVVLDANPSDAKELVVGVDEDNVFIEVVDDTEVENAAVEAVKVEVRDVLEEVGVTVSRLLLDCP